MKKDDSILLARGGSKGLFFRKVPYIIKYIYIKCMPSVATSIIMALMVIMVLAKACLNLFTFLLPYTGILVTFLNYPICSFDLSFLYQ